MLVEREERDVTVAPIGRRASRVRLTLRVPAVDLDLWGSHSAITKDWLSRCLTLAPDRQPGSLPGWLLMVGYLTGLHAGS